MVLIYTATNGGKNLYSRFLAPGASKWILGNRELKRIVYCIFFSCFGADNIGSERNAERLS